MRAQTIIIWITGITLAAILCWYDFATVEKTEERKDENQISGELYSGETVEQSGQLLSDERSDEWVNTSNAVQLMHSGDSLTELMVFSAIAEKSEIVTADHRREAGRAGSDGNGRDRSEDDEPNISYAAESLTDEDLPLENGMDGLQLKERQVAATVNGQPLFVEDNRGNAQRQGTRTGLVRATRRKNRSSD